MRRYATGLIALLVLSGAAMAQAPAKIATPDIILPSKQADSRSVVGHAVPRALMGLGTVASDLVAYFPMDDVANGCLGWSRKPISVKATDKVVIRNADGRTFANFSDPEARLVFDPPLELGKHYTLAAWVQAPVPQNHGVIWHGAGCLMLIMEKALGYWDGASNKSGDYAKTASPLSGWMHVAVACDGNKTQAFLNGTPLDAAKGTVSKDLETIGNHPSAQHHHWMMAAGIDEQYIFNRALSVSEIKTLMAFSQPKK